jgi:hypothetical protein
MSLLHTLVAFIIALGLLIVVHEYGHYLVARWCGVKVLRFSVGFGRPLFTKKMGPDRTEWVIAAIPFGGYVKMLDEREGPVEPREDERAFNRQSVWRRFAIVVAGPLANFLFAVAAYAGLFMYGLPEARPVLAAPPEGTVAAAAGLRAAIPCVRWRTRRSPRGRSCAGACCNRRCSERRCAWSSSMEKGTCATRLSICGPFRSTTSNPTRSSGSACACTARRSSR